MTVRGFAADHGLTAQVERLHHSGLSPKQIQLVLDSPATTAKEPQKMEGITYNTQGEATSFVGRDAVALYRAAVLRTGIGLMAKGIAPTRGASMKKLLALASGITQKPYKRTEHERAQADLKVWIDAMKSALPQEQR